LANRYPRHSWPLIRAIRALPDTTRSDEATLTTNDGSLDGDIAHAFVGKLSAWKYQKKQIQMLLK